MARGCGRKRTILEENSKCHAKVSSSSCIVASSRTNYSNQRNSLQEWTSSRTNPDGHGGFEPRVDEATGDETKTAENDSVTVKFILSGDVWQGFGNQVWAASRHLANMLADPLKCRFLLDPFLSSNLDKEQTPTSDKATAKRHPLEGICMCKLGTGAGVPSWTAMRRGARVVALDQAIPGRIRAVAEGDQRNWQDPILSSDKENGLFYRRMVFPYDWGSPVEDIMALLQ